MRKFNYIILLISILSLSACSEDFLDVKTTSSLTSDDAATAIEADPAKLEGFVNGIYSLLVKFDLVNDSHDAFGYMSILHSTDMMGQDIVQQKFHWFGYDYEHDNHEMTYRRTQVNWTYLYTVISNANLVFAMTSENSTSETIRAFRGQAYALRGMSYYYLIQLYQHTYGNSDDLPGIPLYYATNEGKQSVLGRGKVSDVMTQIELDLTKAVELLDGWNRTNKNQINFQVANGLLARYYLLTEQWQKAADAAQMATAGFVVMPAADLSDGFMDINNDEWMWGFDHNAETETRYASYFSHISNITPGYAGLNYAPRLIDKQLYELIPATDARKKWFQGPDSVTVPADELTSSVFTDEATAWTFPYANVKFGYDGNWTMDYVYMRTAEMILIQAEALARLGKNVEAATKLGQLMSKRDPAWNKTTVTTEEVYLQRRIELWGEGFSFFDLKRLNKGIDRTYDGTNHPANGQIVVAAKAKTWIYQIPQTEIQENAYIEENENNE